MKRHRQIAAAPQRSAPECWATISGLIRDSIARSQHVSVADIDVSLQAADGIGRQLVASGHLDKSEHPITVVAADLHLCLNTVSGDGALTLNENLNFVSGAASAENWTIYLPTPDPLGAAVRDAVAKDKHLSAKEPPTEAASAQRESAEGLINHDALTEWARSQE